MIDVEKYKIPKFECIRNGFAFKGKTDIKYATYIACLYYEFAYHQMLDFSQTCNDFFEENPEDGAKFDTYLSKSWSKAYAIYALLRTCIEAVRKINKALLTENQIDNYYKIEIKKIVDITNDIIKHPMFNDVNNPADASMAYRPVSLDIGGEIDVERWEDQVTLSTTLAINPMKDFEIVGSYLEHVADLLNLGK